jgi:hypothetical protein
VNDNSGKTRAIQISLTEREKVLGKLKKYEQALKLRSDLQIAFKQVAALKKAKRPKTTLKEFLYEL